MDKSFDDMTALLQAVWPSISKIDWSDFCNRGVEAYNEAGVPKYTGLIMHRAGGGCVGASTATVGFIPRPEQSSIIVTTKTMICTDLAEDIKASIERRDAKNNVFGGGVLCSRDDKVAYAISGLPEIGDHLLVADMMWACSILCLDDFNDIADLEFAGVEDTCARVGMNGQSYEDLKVKIGDIVYEAAQTLGLRS